MRFTGRQTRTGGDEYDPVGFHPNQLHSRFNEAANMGGGIKAGAKKNPFDSAAQALVEGVTGTTSRIAGLRRQIRQRKQQVSAIRSARRKY